MSIRRLQGWALILGAVLNLVGLVGFFAGTDGAAFRVISLVGGALFILGVPAIISVQPSGSAGLVGVILLELAAVIAFIVNLFVLAGATALNDAVPLASALVGMLGAVIVGWFTARGKAFAAWIGWAFILQGLLNFAGPIFDAGSFTPALVVITVLANAAALFGYGLGISRHPD